MIKIINRKSFLSLFALDLLDKDLLLIPIGVNKTL